MIYVASSWRNKRQPLLVSRLRYVGLEVYDFREPEPESKGFHWSEIDPRWKDWKPEEFIEALGHEVARHGYRTDMDALERASTVILLMPCGRSAHLEAGYARGQGKRLGILLSDGEPELMYHMAHYLTGVAEEMVTWALVQEGK